MFAFQEMGQLPETGFIRQPQVLYLAAFSSTTLWRHCKAGTFPKPVRLSARICAWRVEDVRAWIKAQGQEEAKQLGVASTVKGDR